MANGLQTETTIFMCNVLKVVNLTEWSIAQLTISGKYQDGKL